MADVVAGATVPEEMPKARVSQLAEVLGVSSREAQRRLAEMGVPTRSVSAFVPGSVVEQLLATVTPRKSRDEGRTLILKAFEAARGSGKDEWRVMTGAVLKNRLLDATDGKFDEADYGAPNLAYFAHLYPDLVSTARGVGGDLRVEIDESQMPAELIRRHQVVATPRFERLRDDLWHAAFDYHSGNQYVWDKNLSRAVVGEPTEDRLVLPTVTPEEEEGWRHAFVAQIDPGGETRQSVEHWLSEHLGTVALPSHLRGLWNGYVRDRAVERLTRFFEVNGLPIPPDLTTRPSDRHRERPPAEVAALRSFVQRCVAVMSEAELEELRFSPSVLLRLERRLQERP